MIFDKDDNKERPESYPKPTETDTQLNNQPEYSEPYPNQADEQGNVSVEIQQAQLRMREGADKDTNKKD